MYRIIPQRIPKNRREEINQKILYVIDTDPSLLSPETIYNCYTGDGGLHGLDFKDFDNYNDYKEAKMEIEMGQFFTAHEICRKICECVQIQKGEKVADGCCGMGNFFNFVPDQSLAWGNEIDPKAVKVARHLYPKANIQCGDIRTWTPSEKFQVLLGNPPFGLHFKWENEDCLSQLHYCLKGHELLDTAGILALVVPMSFMKDTFWNKSDVTKVNDRFTFIGQTELDPDAFKSLGVESYPTKIMVFHKRSENLEHRDYTTDFCTYEELKDRVTDFRKRKSAVRMNLVRETLATEDKESGHTMYEIRKCLYHIKSNPKTRKNYEKALEYIEKFREQKPPVCMTAEEMKRWEQTKITPEKILSYCRRILRKQNERPKDEIHLVYDKHGVRLKGYSAKTKKIAKEHNHVTAVDRNTLLNADMSLQSLVPDELKGTLEKEIKAAQGRLDRERRALSIQQTPIKDLTPTDELKKYLDEATFLNAQKKICHLTDLQKEDLGKVMQKQYALLNWQQGSGKTAASFFFAKRLLETGKARTVFILAPALAINLTWTPFMKNNGMNFTVPRENKDLEQNINGKFVLISLSIIGNIKQRLMRMTRKELGNKACLIFDESDEITNPLAKRTRNTLDIFRRLKYKLLCTGTTTRNNIGELYSQLELLYNNSANMMCWCPTVYHYDKENNLEEDSNDHYGEPFPARGGSTLFKRCFCPGKATVFGIEKFNQDVFNADELRRLTETTITTRKFKEFAGDKYSIHNVTVKPTVAEFAVYKKILYELEKIAPLYFNSTGDSRKEAALRMLRTITLLIKSCSTPHLMPGYNSDKLPTKILKILDMLEEREDDKVAIGCTTLESLNSYKDYIANEFPFRPFYVIDGSISFNKRDRMLKEFESTQNGILLCTQQSLKSSVNIPTCNEVIIEALQWNIPKIQQFFFRAIRFDSKEWTNVHFITYEQTIEQNLMSLLTCKERLNDFLKTGEIQSQDAIYEEYGLSEEMLSALLGKERDKDGRIYFTWGRQTISA